jgi:hypothetical protein
MKYIRSRQTHLTLEEAKLRDVLLEPQKRRVAAVWGDKYLDYEEIEPTKKITQGKWKLSDEDRDKAINEFFATDYKWVMDSLNSLPDEFVTAAQKCLSPDNRTVESWMLSRLKKAFNTSEFNIRRLSISQLSSFNFPIFALISASETKADSKIVRDEAGKPIKDEAGNMMREPKEVGEIVRSGNFGNINTFINSYNAAFPSKKISEDLFTNENFANIVNMVNDNPDVMDFDLFGNHDIYLMIEHNAVHIMNMSVSKFYKSCQELYFGGGHGTEYMINLLMNVFDPNTIPAFLVFDTPYYNVSQGGGEKEKLSDVLPLCRRLIRSIEGFDCEYDDKSEPVLFFDKCYPERMSDVAQDIIEKYSHNFRTEQGIRSYILAPDIDMSDADSMSDPYMDHLSITKKQRIGRNTKCIYLSRNIDWRNVIITPNTVVKEIIVETTKLPSNFFEHNIKSDWVKFKYLKIDDFTPFKNLLTDSIAFYQCNLNSDFISQLKEACPNIKKLSLGSVDANIKNLSILENIEELELIYSLSRRDKIEEYIGGLNNLKKLTLSGDLTKNPSNVEYISRLRKSEVIVELKGLVI